VMFSCTHQPRLEFLKRMEVNTLSCWFSLMNSEAGSEGKMHESETGECYGVADMLKVFKNLCEMEHWNRIWITFRYVVFAVLSKKRNPTLPRSGRLKYKPKKHNPCDCLFSYKDISMLGYYFLR
jgi:hypothetical protein